MTQKQLLETRGNFVDGYEYISIREKKTTPFVLCIFELIWTHVACFPAIHVDLVVVASVNDCKSRETRCLEVKQHAFIHYFVTGLILEMSILTLIWSGCHSYSLQLVLHIMHAASVPAKSLCICACAKNIQDLLSFCLPLPFLWLYILN